MGTHRSSNARCSGIGFFIRDVVTPVKGNPVVEEHIRVSNSSGLKVIFRVHLVQFVICIGIRPLIYDIKVPVCIPGAQ